MTRAAEILRMNRAAERAARQVERAARKALVATKEAKWGVICSPTPQTFDVTVGRALRAQNAAIAAMQKQAAARAAAAAAWRG
jgi:hypothetical protein